MNLDIQMKSTRGEFKIIWMNILQFILNYKVVKNTV